MVDRRSEFSFFQGIHVRIDILNVIIKSMTNKSGKQANLQDLT